MTMQECIKQEKVLFSSIYLKWAFEIAAALVYLAKHNIVHRDLTMNNILVCTLLFLHKTDFIVWNSQNSRFWSFKKYFQVQQIICGYQI